jgi:formate hydrogenlyase subunit 3/multisubunit Na+/H+ antiporter MnhD subunit
MLLAVTVVGLLVSVYARSYFGPARADAGGHSTRHFWPLWLLLLASLNALFLSGDAFNLYVALELKGLSAVALVALAGDRAALGGALRYLFVSLTGSLSYLMGVALLYGGYGTVDLALLAQRMTAEPHSHVALALITAGLMMKSALFPVHFWLPPAHSSAPAPVSAALSALVVKAGFYVLLRFWFGVFEGHVSFEAVQFIGVLGSAAILWGSVQALIQERLKLLVAYSTVAQLGYLFLLFPLALGSGSPGRVWTGGLMFLLSHSAAKAAMFLAAGSIQRAAGHDQIRDLDGITSVLPVSAFTIGLAGISLVGLPPSAGFVGKWLLLGSSLEQGQWWWVAVILGGSLLAAAYMVRLLSHAFTRAPQKQAIRQVSRGMEWSAFALALLSFALGFAATGPARLLEGVLLRGAAH